MELDHILSLLKEHITRPLWKIMRTEGYNWNDYREARKILEESGLKLYRPCQRVAYFYKDEIIQMLRRKSSLREIAKRIGVSPGILRNALKKMGVNWKALRRIRKCKICGREFLPVGNRQFCSKECKSMYFRRKWKRLPRQLKKVWREKWKEHYKLVYKAKKKVKGKFIPLVKVIPDAIVIDFRNKKVLAIEVSDEPLSDKYEKVSYFDEVIWFSKDQLKE